MSKDDRELIACPNPWCDPRESTPEVLRGSGGFAVHCCGLGACGMVGPRRDTEDEAAEAWNTRPSPRLEALQAQPVGEALKKARAQFEFYVQAHLNKTPPDMDKAATNQEFVEMIDAALTASPPVVKREADQTPFSHRDVEDFTLPSERSLRKACDLADMQWTAISMMARNGTIDPGFVRAIYAFARHLDADAILAQTPVAETTDD